MLPTALESRFLHYTCVMTSSKRLGGVEGTCMLRTGVKKDGEYGIPHGRFC